MGENGYLSGYMNTIARYHRWRNELDIIYKIMLALCFAALTGLMMQIRIAAAVVIAGSVLPTAEQAHRSF